MPRTHNQPKRMKRVTVMLLLLAGVLATNSTLAQGTYEEQSLAILKLYESGDKVKRDSAYKLIDRLKSDREARFVPVVLFVRGQMTPDDRSLNLYREAIALDPGGPWADDAAAALVRRYATNRDSLGAHSWLGMLKSNYPRSPLVVAAQDTIAGISDWKLPEAPAIAPKTGVASKTGVAPKNDTVRSQVRRPAQSGTQSSVRRDTAKATKPTSTAKTTSAKPSSTTSSVKKPTSTSATKSATGSTKPATTKTSTATSPTASKQAPSTTASKTAAKPTASTKPTSTTKTVAKPATPKPASDTALSKLRGYALQVGVFPSKEAAQPRLTELQQKKLQVYALPKFIDGKKQYAVIVGPYPTLDDADNRKAEVAAACNCQAFIVKVE